MMGDYYVITEYTPDSTSGYFWMPANRNLIGAAALAGQESVNYPHGTVRLLKVRVPRRVNVTDFMEDMDSADGFDNLPALWESTVSAWLTH